ncbi:MAG: hypothetical protein ACKOI1_04275, partial [Bacteroidota bacterium]
FQISTDAGMTATMEIIFGKPITTPPGEKFLNPPNSVYEMDKYLVDGTFLPGNWKTQIDQGLGHEESTWQKQFKDNAAFLLTPPPVTKDPNEIGY